MDARTNSNRARNSVFWSAALALVAAYSMQMALGQDEASGQASAEPTQPALLQQIQRDIQAGRNEKAEMSVKQWLSQNEDDAFTPLAHYLLGQALYAQQRYKEALANHNQALGATEDRTIRALALFGQGDCNYQLKEYEEAKQEYYWVDQRYRDVRAIPQDELFFKLGMCEKMLEHPESADRWFEKVVELHATGPYADEARRLHRKLGPPDSPDSNFYTVEIGNYLTEEDARGAAEELKEKGIEPVFVAKVDGMIDSKYSVRVGKYYNRLDAMRKEEDKRLDGLHGYVKRDKLPTGE